MPKCPNCGRETLRTEDWACQWCGNPLLSGAFKKIPKTYREIQEEKGHKAKSAPEYEPEPAPAAEVEPEPVSPPPKPEPPPPPEPEPELKSDVPTAPEIAAEAEEETEAEEEPAPPPEPEAEPGAIEEKEPVAEAEKLPAPEAEAEPEPAPEPEAETVTEPVAKIEAEAEVSPEPAPVAIPSLEPETATGIISATVAELNAAFKSDKVGTNSKLLNQTLQVTGTVEKVFARDNLDIFYILLAGAGKSSSSLQVRCTFSREHSTPLSRLTEGQTATVQGTYIGCERNIILKDCRLVT